MEYVLGRPSASPIAANSISTHTANRSSSSGPAAIRWRAPGVPNDRGEAGTLVKDLLDYRARRRAPGWSRILAELSSVPE